MKPSFVAALGAGVAVPAFGLFLRYRRDLNAARARLAAMDRQVISTPWVRLINFDLFVSNADVINYSLETVNVPTLIAHTKDDQLASHEASRRAAERIPGARFVSLESGGHLMLGQQKKNGDTLAGFFAERSDRSAKRVAS